MAGLCERPSSDQPCCEFLSGHHECHKGAWAQKPPKVGTGVVRIQCSGEQLWPRSNIQVGIGAGFHDDVPFLFSWLSIFLCLVLRVRQSRINGARGRIF